MTSECLVNSVYKVDLYVNCLVIGIFQNVFLWVFLHITISSYEFGCLEIGRPYVFRNRNDKAIYLIKHGLRVF